MNGKMSLVVGIILACVLLIFSEWMWASNKQSQDAERTATIDDFGTPMRGLALKVQSERFDFSLGEAFEINVVLKNTTDKPLSLLDTSVDNDYRMELFDEAGHSVPLSSEGNRFNMILERGWSEDSRRFWKLESGASTTKLLSAGRFFAITKPGVYRVVVMRSSGNEWDRRFAVSNMATLTFVK